MRIKKIAIVVSFILYIGSAQAWQVAEIYYTLTPSSLTPLNGSNPVINIGGATVFPSTGKSFFTANNLVPPGWAFNPLSPNVWSGSNWTGLEPQDRSSNSQKAIAATGSPAAFGNSIFQVDGETVGMHLNTWGLIRPRPEIHSSSMQFTWLFPSGVVYGKRPWANPSSQLCMNSVLKLYSWSGPQVQAMSTLGFSVPSSSGGSNFFFVNIAMLDTNPNNIKVDKIINDNPQDTGAPIAITHYQKNSSVNPAVRYSSPIPNYGNILEEYTKTLTRTSSSSAHYGFCISKNQFETILSDINALRPNEGFLRPASDYQVTFALISPEISGEGQMVMSISAMNVYRMIP